IGCARHPHLDSAPVRSRPEAFQRKLPDAFGAAAFGSGGHRDAGAILSDLSAKGQAHLNRRGRGGAMDAGAGAPHSPPNRGGPDGRTYRREPRPGGDEAPEIVGRAVRFLIFDMDGVLVDTCGLHARAYRDLWERCGVTGPAYQTIAGRPTVEVVGEATRELSPSAETLAGWVGFKQRRAREYLGTVPVIYGD